MWTSLNKKICLFSSIIFTIGIIIGFIFLIYLEESSKELISLNINEWLQSLSTSHINSILEHIIILSTLAILSIFVIGLPLIIFFVFYNGFSIGFLLMSLIEIFGVKGLMYGLIYLIITKGIYLFFLTIFILALIKIIILIIKRLIWHQKMNKNLLATYCKRILICIGVIILSDIILYFGGTKLISIFNFLLN